jgi:hypothetical protein
MSTREVMNRFQAVVHLADHQDRALNEGLAYRAGIIALVPSIPSVSGVQPKSSTVAYALRLVFEEITDPRRRQRRGTSDHQNNLIRFPSNSSRGPAGRALRE